MESAPHPRSVALRVMVGACDQCGKEFTQGVGIRETPSETLLVAVCMWCLLLALDSATNFEITEQVLAWTASKQFYRAQKAKGWTARDRTGR